MTEAHWTFSVRDQHGRTRRGRVVYTDHAEAPLPIAGGSTEFVIVLLAAAEKVGEAPHGTAVCVPKPAKVHALADSDANKLPSQLQDLTFRPHRMASYAEGRIVMSPESTIQPADVFPAHSEHPRLDRLALALLETADADVLAPYTALIRYELRLPSGSDALAELAARLTTGDPKSSPPARAPGVMRLAKALRRLRQALPPEIALEEMSEDLRFLRLFEDDKEGWSKDALDRLLSDVHDTATPKEHPRPAPAAPDSPPSNILPMRKEREHRPEDA